MGFLRRLFGGGEPKRIEVQVLMIEPEREDAVLEIVGESNYQPALERLSGGKTPDGTRVAGGNGDPLP